MGTVLYRTGRLVILCLKRRLLASRAPYAERCDWVFCARWPLLSIASVSVHGREQV